MSTTANVPLRFLSLLLLLGLVLLGSVVRAQSDIQWDQPAGRSLSLQAPDDARSSDARSNKKKTENGTASKEVKGPGTATNVKKAASDRDDEVEGLEEDLESVEERVDEVVEDFKKRTKALTEEFEKSIEALGDRVDPLEEFADNDTIVFSGTSNSTMKVSGRIHADYWSFPNLSNDDPVSSSVFDNGDPVDRIGFRRVRFGVKGKINDNMEYKIESEFAGGNLIQFRDVYLGFDELSFFQTILIGNQKRPYGLDHLNSSRYNVFLERPFIIEAFNQDSRRLGIAAYGVSDDERFNWRYGVYNQRLVQAIGTYLGDHYQLELAGRLANTLWYDEISGGRGYAHWAISGTVADPSDDSFTDTEARFRTRPEARSTRRWLDTRDIAGADVYELLGLESVINIGRLQLAGEFQNMWLQRKLGSPSDNLRFSGGYAYVSYFLTGEHIPWNRRNGVLGRVKPHENFWLVDKCGGGIGHGLGAWQIAARYSQADFSNDDIFGGIGESLTVGLNWHWNANARMQFNFIYGNIDDRDDGDGGLTSTDYSIFGTRLMVDF